IDIAVENELDQAPAMTLTKAATLNDGNDGSLDIGDTITYTLTLTNTGNVVLKDVVMNDLIEDLLNQSLTLQSLPSYVSSDNSTTTYPGTPTIAVGETVIYEAVFAINQQAIDAGGVTNTASATAVSPKGESIAVTSNEVQTTIASAPGIEVIKTATINDNGDADFGVGDVVQYTIEVKNTGNVTLDITVEDVLKDNKGVDIALTSGTDKLSIPSSIDPGTSETYTVYQLINQAIVDAGGLTNTATATGTAPDGGTVSDISDDGDTGPTDTGDDPTITPITTNPDIQVTKTATIVGDEDGFVGETDLIDYTIQVTNTGNVTLYNVDLTDTLTDGNGNSLSIDTSAWVVRDIAPGETEIYEAYYIIEQSAAESGSVSNTVTATATDPNGIQITVDSDDPSTPAPNDPTVTEMDQIPSIEVIKTAVVFDNNGDGKNGIGDTIEYTITVENTGNTDLTGLSFVDTFKDL
ncbi:MAG: FxLYD domain-containing protein, partial [Bacteroidota bacterium]|nr:FxLYD domain-containing protein [Bacteroidota bacterium]